jgi:hypothetical protein
MITKLHTWLQVVSYRLRLAIRTHLWKAGIKRRFVLFGPKLDRRICQKLFDDLSFEARKVLLKKNRPQPAREIPVFLHIPKTGGISVGQLFEANLPITNWYNTNERPANAYHSDQFICGVNNPQLDIIQGHFDIRLLEILDRPHKAFTFLRDPVERAVSFFYYLKRYQNDMFFLSEDQKIDDVFSSESACFFENFQTRFLCGKPTEELTVEDLETAKKNLDKHFSFVGTTETLQEDIKELGQLFDFSKFSLQVLNANNIRPAVRELSENTRRLITEKNLFDIQLYDYAVSRR